MSIVPKSLQLLDAFTDIAISLCMVFLLQAAKNDMKQTNDMIDRLVNITAPQSACNVLNFLLLTDGIHIQHWATNKCLRAHGPYFGKLPSQFGDRQCGN